MGSFTGVVSMRLWSLTRTNSYGWPQIECVEIVKVWGMRAGFLSSAIMGVVLLLACQPVPPAGGTARSTSGAPLLLAVDTSHPGATLVIGTQALLRNIVLTDPRFRQANRFTETQVTVRNLTDGTYTLEYKFDWADSEGFAVESGNVWHRFTLSPNQIQTFKSVGKTPEAKTITFTVRFPTDVTIP